MGKQKEQILEHLKSGRSLTVAEALTQYGIYALSQRCTELKRDGHPIEAHMVSLPNGKRIASYRLAEQPGI